MESLTYTWGLLGLVFLAQLFLVNDEFRLAIFALVLYLWPTWHQFVELDTRSATWLSYIPWLLSFMIIVVSYACTKKWRNLWVPFALVAFVYNAAGFRQYDLDGGWRALAYNVLLLLSAFAMRHMTTKDDLVHWFARLLMAWLCSLGIMQCAVLFARDDPERWNDQPDWSVGSAFALALVHMGGSWRYHERNCQSLRQFYCNNNYAALPVQ